MTNQLSRFAATVITILVGTLISDYSVNLLSEKIGKSYTGVALGMLATIVIFYPLFTILEKYIKHLSSKYIQKSKSITGNKIGGLMMGFTLAILILFMMFASVWYGLNPIPFL